MLHLPNSLFHLPHQNQSDQSSLREELSITAQQIKILQSELDRLNDRLRGERRESERREREMEREVQSLGSALEEVERRLQGERGEHELEKKAMQKRLAEAYRKEKEFRQKYSVLLEQIKYSCIK